MCMLCPCADVCVCWGDIRGKSEAVISFAFQEPLRHEHANPADPSSLDFNHGFVKALELSPCLTFKSDLQVKGC